jgi:hypothetical protein
MCMKLMHIGLSLSVCPYDSTENSWTDLDEISYGRYVIRVKSHVSISYNRQYQHGRQTNLWGGIDTSAT